MTRILKPVLSLLRYEPQHHYPWEHLLFRLLIAYLVIQNVPHMALRYGVPEFPFITPRFTGCPNYHTLPAPSSIGALWPGLTSLSDPAIFQVVRIIFYLMAALYISGLAAPIALTYLFAVDTCLGSLAASQGAHGHSNQMMGLVLLGLTLASWTSLFLKSRGGLKNLLQWTRPAQDLALNWGRQMGMAAYMVSAVTKEFNSDGLWFTKSESFILAVAKAQEESIIKGVTITESAQQFAVWMAQHPTLSMGMLASAWLLELSAPLALLNRRIALLLGCLFWVFHYINGWFMGLPFPLNRGLITVLLINIPFWVYFLAKRRNITPAIPLSSTEAN